MLVGLVLVAVWFWHNRSAPLPPIKVGILHSLTGTMAISEKPVVEATLFAIEEINQRGGVLGRRIEPVVVDGRSNWAHFAREARRLIVEEEVSAVFGCWTSACRKSVKPVFEELNNLLFYPVQYEGLESSPNIVYLGTVPSQQIIPAINWVSTHIGRRFYLIGSDYIFPRIANWIIKKQAGIIGAEIVGEGYIPLASQQLDELVAEIARTKPDVVINTLNGDSNLAFFQALKQAGISQQDIPSLSFSIGENEFQTMQAQGVDGALTAWSYFQSLDTESNRGFLKRYALKHGTNPVVSDPMETAYSGVHLWAKAVERAGSLAINGVIRHLRTGSVVAPEGIISLHVENQHTWREMRIGKLRGDGQFEILWKSEAPIRPVPYPLNISKVDAALELKKLYRAWDLNWAAPKASWEDP